MLWNCISHGWRTRLSPLHNLNDIFCSRLTLQTVPVDCSSRTGENFMLSVEHQLLFILLNYWYCLFHNFVCVNVYNSFMTIDKKSSLFNDSCFKWNVDSFTWKIITFLLVRWFILIVKQTKKSFFYLNLLKNSNSQNWQFFFIHRRSYQKVLENSI